MGLLELVGSCARKIFGSNEREDEAAARIRAEIESGELGIRRLHVSFRDGNCSLAGDCPSAEAMEQAVLLAGNVHAASRVDVANLRVPPPAPVEEKVDYYVIEKGDTLAKIAKRYYGDANRHSAIFAANRKVIKNPNLIFPGQKIRVPLSA